MSDLISRADAIEAVAQQCLFEASAESPYVNDDDIGEYRKLAEELFEDVPSADAEPTVIRSKTLMPTKDFKEWANRVREENTNVIVIPCDAEVVDVNKAHEEEHLNIINRIKELQYAIAKTQTIVGKMVESAEAVQGEWIRVGHDIYECSLCQQNVMTKDINCYSYCHRCGARMIGGDDE